MGIIDPAIGLGGGIAQVSVFLQCRLNDGGNGMSESRILGEDLQYTVFDLLNHIRYAIGSVYLHQAGIFINQNAPQAGGCPWE